MSGAAPTPALIVRIFVAFPSNTRANYYGDKAQAGLRALGEVRLNPEARALSTTELIAAARDCQVIVSDRDTQGSAALFEGLPELIAFTRCAVDIRNIDVAAASSAGILVTHASAGFVASVAEWVIGAMIDLGRQFSAAVVTYRAGDMPVPRMGKQLSGSTLGVIGYGQIGRYLCELGLALHMQVRVHDPHARVDNAALVQSDLPDLLAQSDFVVCLAPATAETHNLIDAQAFRQMQPSAYFINASRGELVDEAALAQALDEDRIAGCALDVGRDPDQMPPRALMRNPKVIATPHIGGLTPAAVEHQALETVAQIAQMLSGAIPPGALNPEHATRFLQSLHTQSRLPD